MFSGIRAFVVAGAAVLLVGLTDMQPAYAVDEGAAAKGAENTGADTLFVEGAPSPAEPIALTMDQTKSVAVAAGKDSSAEEEEQSLIRVPLPPAILCLLTAFAGLALLRGRGSEIS